MKNDYCDLTEKEICKLSYKHTGFFLSPFHFNNYGDFVKVPKEQFKIMIDELVKYAQLLEEQCK